MAFLDNSGDIILDAVLTDTGRMRLAKGDGSFRIVKFALADDEIDYSLYNGSHPSGSAYFDLEVLQTPVLEAFSNNVASMKSKLLSISRNNLLFLPILLPNNVDGSTRYSKATSLVNNGYIFLPDTTTSDFILQGSTFDGDQIGGDGLIRGNATATTYHIRVDQGINSDKAGLALDADLKESQYMVELDNRFMSIRDMTPSYIDDDNIASYYFDSSMSEVKDIPMPPAGSTKNADDVLIGPKGTKLLLTLKSQNEIIQSNYLFEQLGTSVSAGLFAGTSGTASNVKTILTNISVTGITTGASVEIPILILKKLA